MLDLGSIDVAAKSAPKMKGYNLINYIYFLSSNSIIFMLIKMVDY